MNRVTLIKQLADSGELIRRAAPRAPTLVSNERAAELELEPNGAKLFEYVISDDTEDRHGDTIAVEGWDYSTFAKSGAVLWAHKSGEPPVQTAEKVWVENGQLRSIAKAFEPGIYPFADMISTMLEKGYLRMTSVGFRAIEWEVREGQEDPWWPELDFKKQEMIEYSIVPAGSNRNAFLQADDQGELKDFQDVLRDYIEAALDKRDEELRNIAEEVYQAKFAKQHFTPKKTKTFDEILKEQLNQVT